ncbi:diaminobutyrate acetyltransferase [Amphibacillus marinus]|uniref:L-2,4-diaminobutyric acid acetyltransferase n=1 Tax=Amphibacillus marinus TaxID=872970 RepID=A0A1H8JZK7_9BACI|nr:diaminobutyrate acetyltransferase [Amphibacillus marinus]SEN86204.1 diaminobutyrate acetyltransferase [Amphibacillus marinus]
MIKDKIVLSPPNREDGKAMWTIVTNTSLDDNSAYKYIMMSHYFSDTCVVAKLDGKVVGFITGFIPPKQSDTVFVWQIGVDPNYKGNGIGLSLLNQLVNQVKAQDINYVEATVTPSNQASQALFKKLALQQQTECNIESFFTQDLFPDEEPYEEELKFKIGPLKDKKDLGGSKNVRRYESI